MIHKSRMIRSIIPGLLPILVFIIFDSFCDPKTAIAAAVIFSFLEMIWHYIRTDKIEKFILFDLILISILGIISVSFNNPLFFKLKPALIEFIIVILLLVSAFTPANIVLMMMKRYSGEISPGTKQLSAIRKSCAIMSVIFGVHTAMIVYSALFMSHAAWAFVSGILFYILAGMFVSVAACIPMIQRHYFKFKYRKDEWFDVLTDDGRITGKAPRSLCHGNPDLLHAAVHLQVFSTDGKILLQKRSSHKDIQPGKWDTAVGGHVNSGETIGNAVIRETSEELRLAGIFPEPLMRYIWESEVEREMIFSFYTVKDNLSEFDPVEIDEIRYFLTEEIDVLSESGLLTPNFRHEFSLLKKSGFPGRAVKVLKNN